MPVGDETCLLQRARHDRNGLAAHAQQGSTFARPAPAEGKPQRNSASAMYLADNVDTMLYCPIFHNFRRRVPTLLVRLHPLRQDGGLDVWAVQRRGEQHARTRNLEAA